MLSCFCLIVAWIEHVGLARAMFKKDAVEISCPDNAAGLYVKSRGGQLVKVYFFMLQNQKKIVFGKSHYTCMHA